MREISVFVGAVLLSGSLALAKPEEWPKWLGPEGTGISTEPVAARWPHDGPRRLWERKVGYGYSSPIGYQGRIYLFSQDGSRDTLTSFDAENGNVAWSQSYQVTIAAEAGQARNPENPLPLPLATPTIDNGRIYSYGGGGDLVCRKIEDGSPIWQLNVLKETGERILMWNEASSPLVTDKFVYVQGGRNGPTAVAVEKQTGKITWRSEAQTSGGYAAPIIADVQGTRQLIIFGNDTLYGMEPDSGKTIWQLPWRGRVDVNASTPVYHDGHLFVSCDYNKGSLMLTLSPTSAKKDWENPKLLLKFQPSILDNGYLYLNNAGWLECIRWPDAKVMWEARDRALHLEQGGSIVRDGDKLIAMSERGKLSLVQATPQGCKLLSQVQLFDFGTTWSTPLIYRGKLYAMGRDNLVCLDIADRSAAAVQDPAEAR